MSSMSNAMFKAVTEFLKATLHKDLAFPMVHLLFLVEWIQQELDTLKEKNLPSPTVEWCNTSLADLNTTKEMEDPGPLVVTLKWQTLGQDSIQVGFTLGYVLSEHFTNPFIRGHVSLSREFAEVIKGWGGCRGLNKDGTISCTMFTQRELVKLIETLSPLLKGNASPSPAKEDGVASATGAMGSYLEDKTVPTSYLEETLGDQSKSFSPSVHS